MRERQRQRQRESERERESKRGVWQSNYVKKVGNEKI